MAAEELNISGLTGVDVALRIAGPGTRAYAFIIDVHVRLLVVLAWAIFGFFSLLVVGAATRRGYQLFIGLPALLLYVLYHPVLEVLMGGRTPGKRMAGCRIVTQEGATPSTGALLIRNVFRLIDSMPGVYALGLGCCFFSAQSVRIGDLAAGTVLVLEESKTAHSLDKVSTLAGRAALEPDTASLVRDLLDRWEELEPHQAMGIARTILVRTDKTVSAEQWRHFAPDMLRAGLEKLLVRTDRAPATASAWLKARAALWQSLTTEVQQAPLRSRATVTEALRTLDAYRTLARDLASARQLLPTNRATAALEDACGQLHVAISRPPRFGRARWRALFGEQVPAAARSVTGKALWIAGLLLASTLAGGWLIMTYPELISLIASEKMIDGVEQGHLWTENVLNVAPSSLVSLGIFSNNTIVTVAAFCAGIFLGLGTFYMIGLNGLMIGALLAFTHQHGLMLGLLTFMMAHGPVELSVICLAGAAGTALGESLIRPTLPTRAQSFRTCATRLGPLLLAFVPLLLGAGLLEGFVSPVPSFSIPFRLVAGWSYWLLMLLFLSGKWVPRARRGPAAQGSTLLP